MNQKQDWLRQVRKARATLNATPIEIIVLEKHIHRPPLTGARDGEFAMIWKTKPL